MDKPTTNQVRQILMNELGLSRKSIREEATKIIHEAVAAEITQMVSVDGLERFARDQLAEAFKVRTWGDIGPALGTEARKRVHDAIRKQVNEHVKTMVEEELNAITVHIGVKP